MMSGRNRTSRDWLRLGLGLALMVISWFAILELSPHLPGAPGETWRHNQTLKTDTAGFFYTETQPVREFFAEDGRYAGARDEGDEAGE